MNRLFCVTLGIWMSIAQAATVTSWVEGVSQSGGWYDANKVNLYESDGDNNLCWAATASNLLAWWQDRYQAPEGVPDTIDDIWLTYKENVTEDVGGDVTAALQWWISGVYIPTSKEEQKRTIFQESTSSAIQVSDGYYYDQYDLDQYDLHDLLAGDKRQVSENVSASIISTGLINLVESGCGVGLSLANDAGELAHAITLWGVEYDDESDKISKLWLTDSDDLQYDCNKDGLFSVDVTVGKNLYITTTDSNWYQENNKVYVKGFFGIDTTVSDTWGIPLAVPEPTTATLSLAALMALALRRRRQ